MRCSMVVRTPISSGLKPVTSWPVTRPKTGPSRGASACPSLVSAMRTERRSPGFGRRSIRPLASRRSSRPKATAKWLAGSVEQDPAEVIATAFDQAEARDPAHRRPWVVLVDGAEHQLSLIHAEAARRGVAISIVIDVVHVLEYLWKAAWCLHAAADPAAEDWGAVKALAVLAGSAPGRPRRSPPRRRTPGLPPISGTARMRACAT
jgi:hypothetical protein